MNPGKPQHNARVRLGLVVNVRRDTARPFGFIKTLYAPEDCCRHFGNGDTYFGAGWLLSCNVFTGDFVLFDIDSPTDTHAGNGREAARFVSARIPVFILAEEAGSRHAFLLHEIAFDCKLNGPANEPVETGFYTANVFVRGTERSSQLQTQNMQPLIACGLVRQWSDRIIEKITASRSLEQALSEFWTPLKKRHPAISGLSIVYHFLRRWLESAHSFLHIFKAVEDLKKQPDALRVVGQAAVVLESIPLKYALWLNGILASPPPLTTWKDIIGWKCVLTTSEPQTVWNIFRKLADGFPKRPETQHLLQYILEQGIEVDSDEACDEIVRVLKRSCLLYPNVRVREANFRARTSILIRLWREEILSELSTSLFNACLMESSATALKAMLSGLSAVRQLQLLSHTTKHVKKFQSALVSAFNEVLPPILFLDIESNGDRIRELAWHYKGERAEYTEIDVGISALNAIIATDNPIVAGHNILQFDLPILKSKGLAADEFVVLDTLLLETVLAPARSNHALRTGHHAAVDAELTASLFNSQIARLCLAGDKLVSELGKLLPTPLATAISKLREQSIRPFLAARNELFSGDEYFHPGAENTLCPPK